MITRETICKQQIHCLSCPLLVWRTGRDCRDLTAQEIEEIVKNNESKKLIGGKEK